MNMPTVSLTGTNQRPTMCCFCYGYFPFLAVMLFKIPVGLSLSVLSWFLLFLVETLVIADNPNKKNASAAPSVRTREEVVENRQHMALVTIALVAVSIAAAAVKKEDSVGYCILSLFPLWSLDCSFGTSSPSDPISNISLFFRPCC